MTVIDDFLPNGGFVMTTFADPAGVSRSASSVVVGARAGRRRPSVGAQNRPLVGG